MTDFGILLVTSVPQLRIKNHFKNRVSIKILNKELLIGVKHTNRHKAINQNMQQVIIATRTSTPPLLLKMVIPGWLPETHSV